LTGKRWLLGKGPETRIRSGAVARPKRVEPVPGHGLILAGPTSGSGKTTVTLGVLRALRNLGIAVAGAKSGPDYIDPQFHEAATKAPCPNLDAWAMEPDQVRTLAMTDGLRVIEGAMGLFDSAPDGRGSTADLARILGLPVVLVIDASRMAQSVAPLAMGFARFDPNVHVAGVILNRVGSERHEVMLRAALSDIGLEVLGAVPRAQSLHTPSRHLGLRQAGEHKNLSRFLDQAGDLASQHIDLKSLMRCATAVKPPFQLPSGIAPPAQRIAIARDSAFSFIYPHLLQDWWTAGAEISFFSPLADEAPPPADLIYLPGGYPELHAGQLAANRAFLSATRKAAMTTPIYGECGGYMVLGSALTDSEGSTHEMLGLLDLETSFADRRLHLGYRQLIPLGGIFDDPLRGHEFHYATTLRANGQPLFSARDATGTKLPPMGLRNGNVSGSFAHIIAPGPKAE